MGTTFIDMTGRRCNMLVVLPERIFRNNRSYWKCRCDCGKEKFVCGSDLRRERVISCGCYRPKRKSNKEVCMNVILCAYKVSARNRNIEWKLEYEVFCNMLFKECYYCKTKGGNELNVRNKYRIHYNGIDRIDNNLPYIDNNVVTCCVVCNRAKSIMTQDQFYRWINRVYRTRYYRRTDS